MREVVNMIETRTRGKPSAYFCREKERYRVSCGKTRHLCENRAN